MRNSGRIATRNASVPVNAEIFFGSSRRSTSENSPDYLMAKKATATDERYLKLAEDHLYSEFSMLLDIPKEHMADYIEQRVHQQKEAEEQVCAV